VSTRKLTVRPESWPVAGVFTISKFSCTTAEVVVVEISQDGATGRGECERTDAYEPDYPAVVETIEQARAAIEGGAAREKINALMHSGSARNAVDCALWDLETRLTGKPAWTVAGLGEPVPCTTVYTISLDTPAGMAEAAARAAGRPILKLKLGGEGDLERVAAVHAAAPAARLSVDANEAWTPAMMRDYPAALAELGVEMIEQPLPAGGDEALGEIDCPLPVAADESCRDLTSLAAVVGRYDLVNIKLDKTGGLTEALALMRAAEAAGLGLMLGCNLGTSLAMAPAMLIAGACRYVDLDGPLLLERDREPGLVFEGSTIHPPRRELWG
jgi:L-alanine-DL-glutamate epimerase-like enolase superfamily enzyme